MLLGS